MTDAEVDSLHILPLHDMPIATKALRDARLVKNARLEGMLELFQENGTGSGQLAPESLGDFFDFSNGREGDQNIIKKLGDLPSYDVYSLRVSLRDLGIDVSKLDSLKLSDAKTRELAGHMSDFTHPLVNFIYGENSSTSGSLAELLKHFADPNAKTVRENLSRLAALLNVELLRIPKFLEDYADVYMSLSFYQQCIEDIEPQMDDFMQALDTIRNSNIFSNDKVLIQDCDAVEVNLRFLYKDLSGILDEFRSLNRKMWENPTGESFREMETLVLQRQSAISSVLCALTVKLLAWSASFPPGTNGQLSRKAAFVIAEMKYGLGSVISPNARTKSSAA